MPDRSSPPSVEAFGQSYSYDALNRVTSYRDTLGGYRNMAYDTWGNVATTSGDGTVSPLTPSSLSAYNTPTTLKNQLNNPALFKYDAAGNMTVVGPVAITYDAEGRQIGTVDSATGSAPVVIIL